jgi:DNA-directed RNA polymerase subunit RPC12/RpoP
LTSWNLPVIPMNSTDETLRPDGIYLCDTCGMRYSVNIHQDPEKWSDHTEVYCPNCGVGHHE